MKLQLKFYLKDEGGALREFPDCPEFIWEDGPKAVEIKGCKFPEKTCVAAFFSERGDDKFLLQLADQPDISYRYLGENGNFFTKKYKVDAAGKRVRDENGHYIRERGNCENLFRGAMGDSVLKLSQRNYDQEWVDIVSINVSIEPDADKRELMQKMALTLLPINPFLVLSNIEGLSKASVSRYWEHGDSKEEEWNAYIEVETIKWIFNRLFPRLFAIISDCAYRISVKSEVTKVGRLRHVDGRSRRAMEKLLLRHGAGMENRTIIGSSRYCDVNVVAHCVIGAFLCNQIRRLSRIERFLGKKIDEKKRCKEEKGETDCNKRNYYERAIREEAAMKKSVRRLKRKIQEVFGVGPWAQSNLNVSIFKATPEDFSFDENYRYVYSLVETFEKIRFLWRNNVGEMLTPSVDYGAGRARQSRWQRNYSYVYEAWVFVSLLKAFQSCGFSMLSQYRAKIIARAIDSFMGQRNNDPVQCDSSDGELQVELFHGVCASKWDPENDINGLSHHLEHDNPLTPDFEIRFVKKGATAVSESEYVILLDAKSGRFLCNVDVQSRKKYETAIYRNQDQDPPHQVWLVYSGISHKSDDNDTVPKAGVEFDHEDGRECWAASETMAEESPRLHNGKFKWTQDGITDGRKFRRSKPFVGHLRGNAVTVSDNNVFEEFVKVQLETVKGYFGIKSSCGISGV